MEKAANKWRKCQENAKKRGSHPRIDPARRYRLKRKQPKRNPFFYKMILLCMETRREMQEIRDMLQNQWDPVRKSTH